MEIADLNLTDRDTWTDEQFVGLYKAVRAEYERRTRVKRQDTELTQIAADNAAEAGRAAGDPWMQPTSVVDSYLEGDVVTYEGKTWVSLIDLNTWAPGVQGWREQVEEGDAPPDFVKPASTVDAYQPGDRVTFEGHIYECVINTCTWSPTEYPQAWKLIE